MGIEGIDITEMEKRRYNRIKNSGEYLELDILIGVEEDELGDGKVCKSPVVSLTGRHCGPKEIGCLYLTLKTYMECMERDYPEECFAAKIAMNIEDSGSVSVIRKKYKNMED